ncbi:MAG: hypothetical protein KDI89_08690, partial [Gammaproteobacteria bacterium]|nr:hypothetical protein [Gammaproteobacteria bacterium]
RKPCRFESGRRYHTKQSSGVFSRAGKQMAGRSIDLPAICFFGRSTGFVQVIKMTYDPVMTILLSD